MYELTAPQKQIYSMEKYVGKSISNICGSFLFREKLSADELERLINEVYRLNDALRIRITENESGVIQEVCEHKRRTFEILHFSSREELDEYARNYAKEPMDITGSLYDVKIVYLNDRIGVIDKMHHIIGDAWSISLLSNQLCDLIEGKTPQAFSYLDYFETERNYQSGKRCEKDKSFFEQQFEKCGEPLLLSDKDSKSFEAERKSYFIDSELFEKISGYAKEKNVTLFSLFLCAFSVYFGRVNFNREKFFIGTTVLNRANQKELNTVGMYVNTVPVLIELKNDKTFAENINGISESVIDAFRHERCNYGALLDNLHKKYNFGGKLYDVLISYQNAKIFSDKTESDWYNNGFQTESLQIHFEDRDGTGGLSVHYDYQTEKFSGEEIAAFHDGFIRLLTNAIENDSLKINEIEILSDDEKCRLINGLNDTAYDFDTSATLYSMFEKCAGKNGDKVCILNSGTTFTGFLKSVEKTDFELRKLTGNRKQIIGVCADRSDGMYIAIYGIIRGGNAYMPIDSALPEARIEYMLENSGASIVLGSEKYRNKFKTAKFYGISELLEGEYEKTAPLAAPDDTAYVIYTSGTTGVPKGAMVSHRSAVNRINWMHRKYPLMSGDVILQKTPYTFDVSVWEIFWWGIFGGSLAFAEPGRHFLPAEIVDKTEKFGVTHLHFVPSVFSVFLDYLEKNGAAAEKLKSLKYIFLSGEALSPGLVKRYHGIFGSDGASLHNLYGPAECAVDVTYYDCTGDENEIPIGRPIDNIQIYITDKFLNPVPFGTVGELCIGGVGVGKGYVNNKALTDEKFVDNPFGNGKIYRTGDLAHHRSDGNIMYDGRTDFQAKINGQRVETEEIKSVLLSIKEISSAEVIVKNSENGKYLAAFYSGKELDENKIFAACSQKLPPYMIPSAFVFVDEIPVTSNGKADRKYLSSLEIHQHYGDDFEEPADDAERMICRSFSEILGIEKVGRNTDFIRSGGSSIDIISFVSDEKYSGITVEDFVSSPTPCGIAKLISSKKRKDNGLLKTLKSGADGKKSLVIFPFAAGTAASFAKLAEKACDETGCTVYFASNVRSDGEFAALSDEITELSKASETVLFGHCIGAQLALNVADYAEKRGASFKGIITCGYVPPFGGSKKNMWNFVPKKLISRLISKAGADFGGLEKDKFISDFIADTDYMNVRISPPQEKIKAPLRAVLCSGDIFTKPYKNPVGNYSRYAESVVSVDISDGGSHYFQNEKADFIVKTIKSAF